MRRQKWISRWRAALAQNADDDGRRCDDSVRAQLPIRPEEIASLPVTGPIKSAQRGDAVKTQLFFDISNVLVRSPASGPRQAARARPDTQFFLTLQLHISRNLYITVDDGSTISI